MVQVICIFIFKHSQKGYVKEGRTERIGLGQILSRFLTTPGNYVPPPADQRVLSIGVTTPSPRLRPCGKGLGAPLDGALRI